MGRAGLDGAGTGIFYQIIEKNGKFSSKPVEHGLLIRPGAKPTR
jgi:hypothetical protein